MFAPSRIFLFVTLANILYQYFFQVKTAPQPSQNSALTNPEQPLSFEPAEGTAHKVY